MARVDKTQSAIAVTRAIAEADFVVGDYDKVIPVGLNATGKVVKGAGQTGIIGVVIPGRISKAGSIMDIFGNGTEIVEVAGLAAGTRYYASAAGAITTTNTDAALGWTVEADRLVVTI